MDKREGIKDDKGVVRTCKAVKQMHADCPKALGAGFQPSRILSSTGKMSEALDDLEE